MAPSSAARERYSWTSRQPGSYMVDKPKRRLLTPGDGDAGAGPPDSRTRPTSEPPPDSGFRPSQEPPEVEIYTALFVGTRETRSEIAFGNARRVQIRHQDGPRELPEGAPRPNVIVASMNVDVFELRRRLPAHLVPIIIVDPDEPQLELAIHEWDPVLECHVESRAAIEFLDQEIDRLCRTTKRE